MQSAILLSKLKKGSRNWFGPQIIFPFGFGAIDVYGAQKVKVKAGFHWRRKNKGMHKCMQKRMHKSANHVYCVNGPDASIGESARIIKFHFPCGPLR